MSWRNTKRTGSESITEVRGIGKVCPRRAVISAKIKLDDFDCLYEVLGIALNLADVIDENEITLVEIDLYEVVEIELISRGILGALGLKHWAWLLKGNDFYCSIEYGKKGIIINTYRKSYGIENACRGCIGELDKVTFEQYPSDISFRMVLQKVYEMKSNWNANKYSLLFKNCEHFVKELGKFISNKTVCTTPNIIFWRHI